MLRLAECGVRAQTSFWPSRSASQGRIPWRPYELDGEGQIFAQEIRTHVKTLPDKDRVRFLHAAPAEVGMTVTQLRATGATLGDLKYFYANGKLALGRHPHWATWKPRGRSPRPPRAKAPAAPDKPKATRPCLGCGRDFPSEGIHNRLCAACRSRA